MAKAFGEGSYHGVKVSLGVSKGQSFIKQLVSRAFEIEQDKTIIHTNRYESAEDAEGEIKEEKFDYSLDVGLKRQEPAFYYDPEDETAETFDRLRVYFQGGTPMGIIKGMRSFITNDKIFSLSR